ncbi:hypothetical protein GUJ93_ZPchr0009g2358 [Zizania palustris]|uniref:Uncharacterized protein n=1 Tax=Zizania palustris TaxID=103762 RepID=A0A8J5RWJ9_ZIZPA|nr:hypothetical protein GUJ93_ZPchr0009g2358 [Zizania palustris]
MASAAFKSTTRRSLHPADDRPGPRKAPVPCPRRFRSVSAAPVRARAGGLGEYAGNTRTNPLFDRSEDSASPSPPLQQPETAGCRGGEAARRERGREVARKGCNGGSERARSVSVSPRRRRAASSPSRETADGGRRRRASEVPSVAGDLQPYRACEIIWQRNHPNVPVQHVLEIPPEFDPDSAEFVSDTSDYATELKKEGIVEIPPEFDPDSAEFVSDTSDYATELKKEGIVEIHDIEHHSTKLQWKQMEIPLEFDPDTVELSPDITKYTTKLKQSHERARKLRADLAVEEQREQELSRMLKGIVTSPNFTEAHKKRPRRKTSIERLKVSRHLAEEAMNYFEECVSISTLDSTDFSSLEDPQLYSVVNAPQKSNNAFFHKGGTHYPTNHQCHYEESDNQTQCSISLTGSDVPDNLTCSRTKLALISRTINNSSDDLSGFDTPHSKSSCFSFTHEPSETVMGHDVQQYLRSLGRGISKELRERGSSYCGDDYVFQKMNADLLMDIVTFENKVDFGGLLVCNIRRF